MSDIGLFGIHAATGPSEVSELIDVITAELKKMANDGPNANEIARAKAQLKAGLLMSLESSSARAEQMARQLLAFGRTLTTPELIAKVDAVTADSVRELAEKLVTSSKPTLSQVGVAAGTGNYDRLANEIRLG